jgi:hypothetical protein
VFKLAAILRLADALDRSHDNRVSDLRFTYQGENAHIELQCAVDCENELQEAERRRDMFQEVFKCEIEFSVRLVKAKKE